MDKNKRILCNPDKSIDELAHEFEIQEENLTKKLIRKIYIIVISMVVVLAAIIIVEFKEFSFNSVTEYKIGKADLGPRDLVWAGIMGTPPSYYESDKKYGLGIKEFETREIRVALQEAGINIIYRYMSPNRLEFEFARKHPVCFYDRKWSNPKEYFKKPRPEILSLALNYSGREPKKIFFRKEDRPRFEKHLDEKGNILLLSLFNDKSLKTELIRAVNYDGPYARENITYGKKQTDGTSYDFIKEKYAKNIDLVILHTNDQILQMLNKKRFDYQFYDTLEYDDYGWIEGGRNRIDTLIYEQNSVFEISDPNLVFHSVACGNHLLAKQAMPIINTVIQKNRNHNDTYNIYVKYAKKLNPLTSLSTFSDSLTEKVINIRPDNPGDLWFDKQFTNFNKTPWPKFQNKSESLVLNLNEENLSINNKPIPFWNLIIKQRNNGEKTLLVIHDTDLKNKAEEAFLTKDFLEKKTEDERRIFIDKKVNFRDLDFSKVEIIKNLIIFARGIKDQDFHLLKPIYHASTLKGFTLIEGSIQHGSEIQNNVSKNLELFRLFDTPIVKLPLGKTLASLVKLKSLALHVMGATNEELLSIIKSIPSDIEELSLSENDLGTVNINWFPNEFVDTFVNKKFSNLKFLQINNLLLDDFTLKQILDATPLELESLILGCGLNFGNISSLVIEEFLNKRYLLNKLKLLRIKRMIFSWRNNNKLMLPKSLEDLSLTWTIGPLDGQFERIIFHPEMQLKNLDLSKNNLTDHGLKKIFNYLNPDLENLILSENKITGKIFLNTNNIKNIDNLRLDSNPIDDQGLVNLSHLSWGIKNLDISNTKISDLSFNIFSYTKMPSLSKIDVSDNYLSKKYINNFLERYLHQLTTIKLRNVLSLDIKAFSNYLPDKLDVLDLSSNLLSDEQIIYLSSHLPKNLRVLDISGSRMGAQGVQELVKRMPDLTQFYFNFRSGQEEKGLKYLLPNLSPFLINMSPFNETLSYTNTNLLATYFPIFLKGFIVPELEREECKILLSSFPNALKSLELYYNIKSKGASLKHLSEHYPSQLRRVGLSEFFDVTERNTFLKNVQNKLVKIHYYGIEKSSDPIYFKYLPRNSFTINDNRLLFLNDLKKIVFNPSLIIHHIQYIDKVNDLFIHIQPFQLKYVKMFFLENMQLKNESLITIFKKLPTSVQFLAIRNLGIKYDDVDKIIEVLPKNLRKLNVSINLFGEKGLIKFRAFKKIMEERTGLPFELVE